MRKNRKLERVVVFGIFDGIHEGHRNFFYQAFQHGDVVAIVGRDTVSEQLKKRKPEHSEEERCQLVEQEKYITKAVLGDTELSLYKVMAEVDPDIICLGYDQEELEKDLIKWLSSGKGLKIIKLHAYQPNVYHNSFLK